MQSRCMISRKLLEVWEMTYIARYIAQLGSGSDMEQAEAAHSSFIMKEIYPLRKLWCTTSSYDIYAEHVFKEEDIF